MTRFGADGGFWEGSEPTTRHTFLMDGMTSEDNQQMVIQVKRLSCQEVWYIFLKRIMPMMKFLVVHYNRVGEACLNLLAEQPRSKVLVYLTDPRPLSDFKSAIRKFKRLMITYFMGNDSENKNDYDYNYVVVCGEETSFSLKAKGTRITPQKLAEMFPGDWSDALTRMKKEKQKVV